MNFVLLIPTYKRPKLLIRTLDSFKFVVGEKLKDVKCYIYFSSDDEESYNELQGKIDFMDTTLVLTKGRLSVFEKVNLYFKEHTTADVVIGMSDDVLFVGTQMIDAMNYYENNFKDLDVAMALRSLNVYGNKKHKYNDCSYIMLGRNFINMFPGRQVCCPLYTSHYVDGEIKAFARAINKWQVYKYGGLIIHDRTGEHYKTGICANGISDAGERKLFIKRRKKGRVWGR